MYFNILFYVFLTSFVIRYLLKTVLVLKEVIRNEKKH